MFEDESQYEDEFLGMNGRAILQPLPSNISLAFPSTQIPPALNYQVSMRARESNHCHSFWAI